MRKLAIEKYRQDPKSPTEGMIIEDNSNSEINVDLWPDGVWTRRELDSFKDLVGEFGSTSGQISSDMRGFELQIVLAFLAHAIASGFFKKLGSDLYEYLRDGLKQLLLKPSDNDSETDQINGRLSFSYRDHEAGLYAFYTCIYSSEKELNILFASLYPIDSLIVEACRKSLFPFSGGNAYNVHAILKFDQNPTWNIRIGRSNTEKGGLILNEFFHADLVISKLAKSKWDEIDWDYQPGLID